MDLWPLARVGWVMLVLKKSLDKAYVFYFFSQKDFECNLGLETEGHKFLDGVFCFVSEVPHISQSALCA